MSGIWIFAEQRDGQLRKAAFELLGQGRKIADQWGEDLNVLLLGNGVSGLTATLAENGADTVYVADAPSLAEYHTEAYVDVLGKVLGKDTPKVILLGHTAIGKDLAPRLAQRLGCGLVTDCIDMEIEDNNILFNRPVYAGKAFNKVRCDNSAAIMATLRPNVFEKSDGSKAGKGATVAVEVALDAESLKSIIKEVIQRVTGRVELTEADIIVSGGRGMKGPENFKILEDLADVLGAAVGASRAAVDAGWREQQFQVGQTGKVVSPTLYIACGISGAIQHLAGMGSSKFIVAINKDPEANIFKVADYGIIADLFKVVPLLTEEFKKLLKA
ncbi:MAG: electron transfer flavoprotein subunit alpha/FixB family protein [Bacillota bacterium]|jgi:electron transfer flavoprotein alpha subunit